jgi:predicted protein tyrosine phosphatase
MSKMNRIGNSKNQFQGSYKRVLCVCSAGLLRSPTTAVVLSQDPYNYNTRAAGLVPDFALIIVDDILLNWADEIVCMMPEQRHKLEGMVKKAGLETPVYCLEIEDSFEYRNPELIESIKANYDRIVLGKEQE